jgi:O-methyltransferase involved in polyketide biosynthesis
MASRQSIQLGQVQESLLVPLYARAIDSLKKRPILKDPKAVEMVQSIDWDFRRFNQRRRVVGCTLRTAIFDEWVKDFLSRHPEGTVVEIGAGLNTRFERLDNGTVHWFDLDLPDTVELRRKFFIWRRSSGQEGKFRLEVAGGKIKKDPELEMEIPCRTSGCAISH